MGFMGLAESMTKEKFIDCFIGFTALAILLNPLTSNPYNPKTHSSTLS
jgi:hypothetical protein